jgi:hypothetical protein
LLVSRHFRLFAFRDAVTLLFELSAALLSCRLVRVGSDRLERWDGSMFFTPHELLSFLEVALRIRVLVDQPFLASLLNAVLQMHRPPLRWASTFSSASLAHTRMLMRLMSLRH